MIQMTTGSKKWTKLKMNQEEMTIFEFLKSYENLVGRNDQSLKMKTNYPILQFSCVWCDRISHIPAEEICQKIGHTPYKIKFITVFSRNLKKETE